MPSDAGVNPSALAGRVACPSATRCLLVGTFADSSATLRAYASSGLVGPWSKGTEIAPPTNANADPGVSLDALSCPSPSACIAAGSYTDRAIGGSPMVADWNSGTWSRGIELTLPFDQNSSRSSALSALSCSARTSCVAVGNYINAIDEVLSITATERDGHWGVLRVIPPPSDLGAAPDEPSYAGAEGLALLNDMSCTSATSCVAVGEYSSARRGQVGLIATLAHGRWSERAAPVPNDAVANPLEALTSVSCRSGLCVAVGYYSAHNGTRPLVELETNGTWRIAGALVLPTGGRPGQIDELDSVSCASSSSCVAVGEYTTASGLREPMFVSGSATKWPRATRVAVPDDAARNPLVSLTTVTCVTSARCIAAGSYLDVRNVQQAFVVSL